MYRVQGCSHKAVAHFVNGDYEWLPSDKNHGRDVFAKEPDADGVTALIYFWNGAEGYPAGWYFGDVIGCTLGQRILAYHPASWDPLPPAKGWRVPQDGPADSGMVVSWIDDAGSAVARAPVEQQGEVLAPVVRQDAALPVGRGTPTPATARPREAAREDRPGGRWDRGRQRKEAEAESGMDRSCPGVASYDVLAQSQAIGGRPSAPFRKVRRGRESAEVRRPDQPMVAAEWPELPPIQGESRHAGKPPRGAGIIAFRDGQSAGAMRLDHYVCIVQKADGKSSFPKGGRKAAESLIDAAFREWQEECGIPGERLQLVRGFHVDEPMIGVRYLLAHCTPNANSSGPDPPTPGESAWRPPAEDLSDNDPIVKARWVSVEHCLRGELSEVRRELLRQAIAVYKHSRLGRSMG
mmetsp:Transcript_70896/g.140638  ORF Transcript_70896/g.140638 Transcript_70896/m.140638 type:complete len:408 (+) Transcript_70896:108-1331(+)